MYETDVTFDDQSIRLSLPVFKVDAARRIVHGFATLDNLDKQDDIVTRTASLSAFERFRGNLREQHDPKKAVGKVVKFREDTIFDQETNKAYNGVFVSAYISKGAEDTWQKVLDGTLSGFSIGGAIKDTEIAFDEDLDKTIRIIHDYDLVELSLVDSPANQLANVLSVEKVGGKMVYSTPMVKGDIETIFWCGKDNIVVVKSTDSAECAVCGGSMSNAGFVEANDMNKRDSIKSSLDEFKRAAATTAVDLKAKEASDMADQTTTEDAAPEQDVVVEKSDSVVEESAPIVEATEQVEKSDQVEEEQVEKSEQVEEERVEEESEAVVGEVAKTVDADAAADKVDELSNLLVSSLSTLADAVKTLNSKIEDMNKSLSSVQAEVKEVKGTSESLGKRVDSVEETTAFRKSGDLGEVVQESEIRKSNSLWGGRFLNAADL